MEKWFGKIIKGMAVISSISTLVIMVVVLADVGRRTILGEPILGVLELSELLLVVVVGWSIAWTQYRNRHVNIDVLILRMSTGQQTGLRIIMLLLSTAFFGVLAVVMGKYAYEGYQIGEASMGLIRFPIWPGKFILSFGAFMMTLVMCMQIVREAGGFVTGLRKPVERQAVKNV